MPIQEKCRIIDHQEVAPKHFKLTLASKYISSHSLPGQFVNLKCSEGLDPLLRRPFSIHRNSEEHERFELLYEVVGKGTEILSSASVGSEIDVLGPLGIGWQIDKSKKIAILVGGGMGIAPLAMLAEQISKTKDQKSKILYVLIGAQTKDKLLCEKDCKEITDQVLVSTDDGSHGKKGFISDVLLDVLENTLGDKDLDQTTIYTCGPQPMLKAVTEIAWQKKINCQVSMEQHMACGIGTCLGCVIQTKNGYKKVCDEGPVFKAEDLILQ